MNLASGKKISVVLPVYNEEQNISLMYGALKKVFLKLEVIGEYIFVNDGSSDKSLVVLRELAGNDSSIKVLSFTRNFGHQAALTAGLDIATGDAIITMDCDFQDPPDVIPEMVEKWVEGNKIIYGRRLYRKDRFFKRISEIGKAHV